MCDLDDIDMAWSNFCIGNYDSCQAASTQVVEPLVKPICSSLYVSTKTIISYVSSKINLQEVFWNIPIIEYAQQIEGVVKKQMKFHSLNEEDIQILQQKIVNESEINHNYVDEYIITRIVNPEGRIKFKDVRKVSVGLSNKDIISYRCKKKGAFYNCFVMILRLKHNNIFKEIHVKVFNTGKLEIPGIQNNDILNPLLTLLVRVIGRFVNSDKPLHFIKDKCETVLINSNFNCGYFIDRDKLFELLKYKYNIKCAFDPCSYPGIQCVFYYDSLVETQTGKKPEGSADSKNITKVSVMIFRTGSVLVVGKSNETVIQDVYNFIRKLLENEFCDINDGIRLQETGKTRKKIRKRKIIVSS